MSETKKRKRAEPTSMVRIRTDLADRMNDIEPPSRRAVWVEAAFAVVPLPPEDAEGEEAEVARAVIAPAEPVGEVAVAETETEVTMALPERGERAAGLPVAGSPPVPVKTVWATGRSGLGEPVEWVGAVVHLPEDCRWFLSLDDASRADAVRRSLARCRDVAAEREDRLASMSAPEGHVRPDYMPKLWEPVVVWVPSKAAVWSGSIQDHIEAALGANRTAALLAETKKAGGKT